MGVGLLLPLLVTACGVTAYLSTSYATDCLRLKNLAVFKGTLLVPNDLKNGPRTRKVTKLDVMGGPKDNYGFGNHVVVLVTSSDSDIGNAIMFQTPTFSVGKNRVGPPEWVPKGAYVAGYKRFVAIWDTSPTPKQAKLVEDCFH